MYKEIILYYFMDLSMETVSPLGSFQFTSYHNVHRNRYSNDDIIQIGWLNPFKDGRGHV